jgi:hypothetical protein
MSEMPGPVATSRPTGGADVRVLLDGREDAAHAMLEEDPIRAAEAFRSMLGDAGPRALGVKVNVDRAPTAAEIKPAGSATHRVRRMLGGALAAVSLTLLATAVPATAAQQQAMLPFTGLSFPAAVAVDGSGDVFVGDVNLDNAVLELAPGATQQTTLPFSQQGGFAPVAVAVDGSGDVFVADSGDAQVLELASGATQETTLPFTGLAGPGPWGVAVDGSGDVFVADSRNNRVLELANGATQQTTLPFTGLNLPSGLAVDGSGDVFVADSGNNRVLELANGATQQTVVPFTGLGYPSGVAVDASGDVFATDEINDDVVELLATPLPPTITSIAPSEGPSTGYTKVTITGTGFSKVGGVFFGNQGDNECPVTPGGGLCYHVDSPTQITADSPPVSATGTVDVEVDTEAGNSAHVVADRFTYGVASVEDAGRSSVEASNASVQAGGSQALVTVTLRDAAGNPVDGKTVTLAAGSGSSVIAPASAGSDTTSQGGIATFNVTDATAEGPITYRATGISDNVAVIQSVQVTFTAPVSSGGGSGGGSRTILGIAGSGGGSSSGGGSGASGGSSSGGGFFGFLSSVGSAISHFGSEVVAAVSSVLGSHDAQRTSSVASAISFTGTLGSGQLIQDSSGHAIAQVQPDGRVIAVGAGNVIAVGAGNVIAVGAGNFGITDASGHVIAVGAGNLNEVRNDSFAIEDTAGHVIAVGAGNVIAVGAGNVIAVGAGNVIAVGAGNVIAVGAGNVIAVGAGNLQSIQSNVIAVGAGNFTETLTLLGGGASVARAAGASAQRGPLLASAHVRFSGPGSQRVVLTFTATARRTLARLARLNRARARQHKRPLALSLRLATSMTQHGRTVTVYRSFTVKPGTSQPPSAHKARANMAGRASSPRALAASAPCRSTTATIIRTEGVGGTVLDFSAQNPLGAPLRGNLLRSAGQGHFYQLSGLSATLRWGSNTYELSHGTTVALGCYGQAKGANVFYPALRMLSGTATVLVSASDPGAVLTNEGLYGPIPGQQLHHGYTFRVTRALRAPADHTGLLNWFANYANQPTGTSTIVTQDSSLVNVTPYVGPRRGNCRHVRKAILVSTGMQSVGAGQYVQTGSSQYSG